MSVRFQGVFYVHGKNEEAVFQRTSALEQANNLALGTYQQFGEGYLSRLVTDENAQEILNRWGISASTDATFKENEATINQGLIEKYQDKDIAGQRLTNAVIGYCLLHEATDGKIEHINADEGNSSQDGLIPTVPVT